MTAALEAMPSSGDPAPCASGGGNRSLCRLSLPGFAAIVAGYPRNGGAIKAPRHLGKVRQGAAIRVELMEA